MTAQVISGAILRTVWLKRVAGPATALHLLVLLSCAHRGDVEAPRAADAGAAVDRAAIERIVASYREKIPGLMEENDLPGLAVALVDRAGPLWVEGFGYLDRGRRIPVDARTIFSMQSTSKSVTATAALVAVRDGLVDLDRPVSEYLPNFTVNSRFEDHPVEQMTLRHLLAHRAGFTHEAPVGNNYAPDFRSFEAHVESIRDTWLRYPVGLHYAYANLGVDLAGYILGVVSGLGFPGYLRQAVLEPLDMEDSSFDWEAIRVEENRALGHWSLVDSMPLEYALIPSGGLYASARDMAKFLQFQLNDGWVDGRELLSPTLLAEMREPAFAVDGQDLGYGLGLRRYERYGRYYFNHAGAGFGFKCHMSWYPHLGVGIAVLSNSMDHNLVHSLAGDVIGEIQGAAALGEPTGERPFADLVASDVDPEAGRRLLGTYLGRGSARVHVSLEDGVLSLSLGGGPVPLQLISETAGFVDWDEGHRDLFRFELEGSRPWYVLRVRFGWHCDFDQGPDGVLPGPDEPEWNAFVGDYEITLVDKVIEVAEIRRENGHLYFDQHRLVDEHEPGLFFSVKGEALDLRGEVPTWRNIPLRKTERQD
jgi:CubicO group peptidase (beta-lactamase class C family)